MDLKRHRGRGKVRDEDAAKVFKEVGKWFELGGHGYVLESVEYESIPEFEVRNASGVLVGSKNSGWGNLTFTILESDSELYKKFRAHKSTPLLLAGILK